MTCEVAAIFPKLADQREPPLLGVAKVPGVLNPLAVADFASTHSIGRFGSELPMP